MQVEAQGLADAMGAWASVLYKNSTTAAATALGRSRSMALLAQGDSRTATRRSCPVRGPGGPDLRLVVQAPVVRSRSAWRISAIA